MTHRGNSITTGTHSIYVPGENIDILLEMRGVISYFGSHKPSTDELDNCRRLTMCSDVPRDPNAASFAEQEMAVTFHSRIPTDEKIASLSRSKLQLNPASLKGELPN